MREKWLRPRTYLGLLVAALVLFGAFVSQSGSIFKWRKGRTIASPYSLDFRLTDVTESSGIRSFHKNLKVHPLIANVGPWFEVIGASVAVVDFDNDGWPDVFLNNTEVGTDHHLYRNNRDGTFTDVIERSGLNALKSTGIYRVFFVDFDNDGFKDVMAIGHCPRLFRGRRDGTYFEVTAESRIGCGFTHSGANVIDYDEDGYLDLVLGPFIGHDLKDPKDTFVTPDSLRAATNGKKISIFRNDRHGNFFPSESSLGIDHIGWTHAISAYDIRNTGRPDLWFATDFNLDAYYFNEGSGRFRDMSPGILSGNFSRNGMSADFADVDNDGHPLVYTSHIYIPGQEVSGNLMWKWIEGNRFKQIAEERGVADCGWSWGAKFMDFDNDGRLDLFVGNGFVSANPSKTYWFSLAVLDSAGRSVIRDARNWTPFHDSSLAGYQRACLFLNVGSRFVNVAGATALANDASDERGIGVIDYLNNGSQSLILADQNASARLYRNEQLKNRRWIGFKLIGTRSNRDAIGAKITLVLGDRTMNRQLQPLNSFATQVDDRLHFGLGDNPVLKKAVIEWPSHRRQELEASQLNLDQYHTITEPH